MNTSFIHCCFWRGQAVAARISLPTSRARRDHNNKGRCILRSIHPPSPSRHCGDARIWSNSYGLKYPPPPSPSFQERVLHQPLLVQRPLAITYTQYQILGCSTWQEIRQNGTARVCFTGTTITITHGAELCKYIIA